MSSLSLTLSGQDKQPGETLDRNTGILNLSKAVTIMKRSAARAAKSAHLLQSRRRQKILITPFLMLRWWELTCTLCT